MEPHNQPPEATVANQSSVPGMMRMFDTEEGDSSMTSTELRKSVPNEVPISTSQDLTKKREKNRVAAAASRARKKEYVQNLEKAIHVLTTEKLELQVKVATLTNQLWEQSIKIDDLEKQLAEAKGLHHLKSEDPTQEMPGMAQFSTPGEDPTQQQQQQQQQQAQQASPQGQQAQVQNPAEGAISEI